MKGKLKIVIPLALLLALGGGYKFVLAKPKPEPKHKVEGQVYVLPKEFTLNTADDRYAKLWVALVLPHDEPIAGAHGAEAAEPPEGFGPLPQEALVRALVTDAVNEATGEELIRPRGRHELQEKLLTLIKKRTDVHAEDVVLTDVAVQ